MRLQLQGNEIMTEKSSARLKKPASAKLERPRNRYVRDAKLSEYKFLQVLKGFADLRLPSKVANETGISEKTIRKFFHAFQLKIKEAIKCDHQLFGGAGLLIFRSGYLTKHGEEFLKRLNSSDVFAMMVLSRTPRFKRHNTDISLYLWELLARYTCNSSRRFETERGYDNHFLRALRDIEKREEIAWSIIQNDKPTREDVEFVKSYLEVQKIVDSIFDLFDLNLFLDNFNPHSDVKFRIYEELRQYLLKHPISFREISKIDVR